MKNPEELVEQTNGKHKHTAEKSGKEFLFGLALYEVIFLTVLFCSLPWACHLLYELYHTLQKRAAEHADKNIPKIADFFDVLYYMVIFIALRLVFAHWLFLKLGDAVLPRDKWDEKVRYQKVDRFGGVVFKLFFFILISLYGFYLFADSAWIPPLLGGTGDIANVFRLPNYPIIELDPGMKKYYLIQCAYHAHSLLFQFRMIHRSDFWEMLLHHVITLFLIGFSYLCNLTRIGSLVFLTHDFSDFFGYFMKAVVDTSIKPLILIGYICLLLSWGFCRLFAFPFYIIETGWRGQDIAQTQIEGFYLLNVLMCVLFCLHCYWYSLFLRMGYVFATRGKAQDMTDKIKKQA